MWTFDAMGTCVLVLTLGVVFVIVLLVRQQRTGKEVPIWLLSGLVGALLGAAAAAAAVQLLGYQVVRRYTAPEAASAEGGGQGDADEGMPAGMMGPGMGGMGGGMPGMGGGTGMGGGRGFGRRPGPRRQLTSLVRKLELLTGDIALKLSDQQKSDIVAALAHIEKNDELTDEQAKETYDQLLGLLEEAQRAKLDAIRLPFDRRRGRGGGFGPPGGGAGPSNPFRQEENTKALQRLRQRLGARPARETAEPSK